MALCARERHNLIVAPGAMFGVNGDADEENLRGKVRVCFAWEQESAVEEGIKRLGGVIRDMLGGHGTEDLSTPAE